MAEPRERPILFSGPMVRALLEGRKTQTRRVIIPQPNFTPKDIDDLMGLSPVTPLSNLVNAAWQAGFIWVPCPFGKPGDRLWVRETWYCDHCFERDYETTRGTYRGRDLTDAECEAEWRGERAAHMYYRADGEAHTQFEQLEGSGRIWKPSIHMPRWASRLLLEVTEVRVQRLQDITEEDAQAEGARRFEDIPLSELDASVPWGAKQADRWSMETPRDTSQCLATARYAFANYVNQLHGGPRWNCKAEAPLWDTNPWVWALSFRRVEGSR